MLSGWQTSQGYYLDDLCTQPSEVWHLCKWHLHICIFDFSTGHILRHLKWVKTTNFQILRNATSLSATNQHSSKWYPRLQTGVTYSPKRTTDIDHKTLVTVGIHWKNYLFGQMWHLFVRLHHKCFVHMYENIIIMFWNKQKHKICITCVMCCLSLGLTFGWLYGV